MRMDWGNGNTSSVCFANSRGAVEQEDQSFALSLDEIVKVVACLGVWFPPHKRVYKSLLLLRKYQTRESLVVVHDLADLVYPEQTPPLQLQRIAWKVVMAGDGVFIREL